MTGNEPQPGAPNDQPAPSYHGRIFLGLALGAGLGLAANALGTVPLNPRHPWDDNHNGLHDAVEFIATNFADTVGQVFLRLMSMMVVPLVYSALALAVVDLGNVRRLGRVGLRTLLFTALLSSTAVVLGIGIVNLMRPGAALPEQRRAALRAQYGDSATTTDPGAKAAIENARRAKSVRETLLDLIPKNPLQEMVGALDGSSPGGGMLALMTFALATGLAITAAGDECQVLVGWLRGLYAIAMVVIGFAMKLAPLGAGCLVFVVTARLGFDIVRTLTWFIVTALLGLGLHQFVVYPVVIALFGGRSPVSFFRAIAEAMLVAFGTSSSSATLPTALRVASERLRLPPQISNFVLTVGATGNQNGTALYEGLVVLFLAQVFGVELGLGAQIRVVLMSILAGVGTAGVPGGSLPLIVVLLESVGVPGAGIGIILGVDRILDMSRTTLNVTGDLVVATCVARGQAVGTDSAAEPDPPVVEPEVT